MPTILGDSFPNRSAIVYNPGIGTCRLQTSRAFRTMRQPSFASPLLVRATVTGPAHIDIRIEVCSGANGLRCGCFRQGLERQDTNSCIGRLFAEHLLNQPDTRRAILIIDRHRQLGQLPDRISPPMHTPVITEE